MTEKTPFRPNRSGFLVPGNWMYHRNRPSHESKRAIKWPASPPPQKEAARPTQSIIGFMRWMRKLMDRIEAQRHGRLSKMLARVALRRAAPKIATPSSSTTAAQQPGPARPR
jgi:hypothetical protein